MKKMKKQQYKCKMILWILIKIQNRAIKLNKNLILMEKLFIDTLWVVKKYHKLNKNLQRDLLNLLS